MPNAPPLHSGYAPSYAPPQGLPPSGYVAVTLSFHAREGIDRSLPTGSLTPEVSRVNILPRAPIIRSRSRVQATYNPPGRRPASILLPVVHRPINTCHLPVVRRLINISHPQVAHHSTNTSHLRVAHHSANTSHLRVAHHSVNTSHLQVAHHSTNISHLLVLPTNINHLPVLPTTININNLRALLPNQGNRGKIPLPRAIAVTRVQIRLHHHPALPFRAHLQFQETTLITLRPVSFPNRVEIGRHVTLILCIP